MAFPQVIDADTKAGEQATVSSSWAAEYPTNIAAGDLLLLLVGWRTAAAQPTDPILPAVFSAETTRVHVGNTAVLCVARGIATGSESGAFTVDWSGDRRGMWRALRIPAVTWEGTLAGGVALGSAEGFDASPDPPSLDPSAWDTADTLWLAAAGIFAQAMRNDIVPANYTNLAVQNVPTNAYGFAIARRELAAASEDPGVFGSVSGHGWVTFTVAVQGAGVVPPDAPTNPAAVAVSTSQIDVSWNDVATEDEYRVERSPDGVGSWVDISGSLAADTTSYSDTGLDPSTEYFYRVIATNADGDSSPSTVVSATTNAAGGGGGGDNRMTGGAIRKPPRTNSR